MSFGAVVRARFALDEDDTALQIDHRDSGSCVHAERGVTITVA